MLTTDGTIDGALAARSPRIVPDGRTFSYVLSDGEPLLTVTQNDIRQIQLAKAALHAGCMLLCERYGIDHVDRIRLAGAFGNHIDPVHALVLGLVPDCDPANVTSAGNAAGTGARIALLDRSARAEIEEVVRRVEKIETAVEPRFQELFVGAMAIPHDTDPYERLRAAVTLPPRRVADAAEGRRRRRGADPSPPRGARHDRDDRRPPQRRPRRPAGRARHLERGQRAVHHARAEAVRGARPRSTCR